MSRRASKIKIAKAEDAKALTGFKVGRMPPQLSHSGIGELGYIYSPKEMID